MVKLNCLLIAPKGVCQPSSSHGVLSHAGSCMAAVPVPEPIPVAINFNPTVFAVAPHRVKSVVPTLTIMYSCPASNPPANTMLLDTVELTGGIG